MRIDHALVTRPAYYDRNPIPRASVYDPGSTAPHAATTRWTYTVPSGKKAYLETAFAQMIRETVATTAAIAKAIVQVNLVSGGGTVAIVYALNFANAVGSLEQVPSLVLGSTGLLVAGDVLSSVSQDASTGGTHIPLISAKYTEFDA